MILSQKRGRSGESEFSNQEKCIKSSSDKPEMLPQTQPAGLKTIFVENLSLQADYDDVYDFFHDAGEVARVLLANTEDGGWGGMGYVEFATKTDAEKAIMELNGQKLLDHEVKLSFAIEEITKLTERMQNDERSVFVSGFDVSPGKDTIRSCLESHFESCGGISSISVHTDYCTSDLKGSAFIIFEESCSVLEALKLNSTDIGGFYLHVSSVRPWMPEETTELAGAFVCTPAKEQNFVDDDDDD